jgi:hypothetical protein
MCLGFYQLSSGKKQGIETNRWLSEVALPKPKNPIGKDGEACFAVL